MARYFKGLSSCEQFLVSKILFQKSRPVAAESCSLLTSLQAPAAVETEQKRLSTPQRKKPHPKRLEGVEKKEQRALKFPNSASSLLNCCENFVEQNKRANWFDMLAC